MEDRAHLLSKGARSVAVVGGGYAGMAAAVELAGAGLTVTVFEAAPELGGRARRVMHRGTTLDNGLHIGIGAYRTLLELGARVRGDRGPDSAHGADAGGSAQGTPGGAPGGDLYNDPVRSGWHRHTLDWRIGDRLRLHAPHWPAPLHLIGALAGARGLSFTARWQAIRLIAGLRRTGYRIDDDPTVAEWLERCGQGQEIIQSLWAPLCVAALNTPAEAASAQVFACVVRDSLGAERAASDLLLPATDLTALFPEPAAAYVKARGGRVLCGTRVDRIAVIGAAAQRPVYQPVCSRARQQPAGAFDALVLAVAPRALGALTADWPALAAVHSSVSSYQFEPISSVYLQYPQAVSLAFPMIGLDNGPGQWAFDRGHLCGQAGLIGVVVSASAALRAIDGDTLAAAVHRQVRDLLARRLPDLPAPAWSKLISEKLATFACTPGLTRPGATTGAEGVFIAGDHVASDYPATLEAAVRSGRQAATLAGEYLRAQG